MLFDRVQRESNVTWEELKAQSIFGHRQSSIILSNNSFGSFVFLWSCLLMECIGGL